MRGYIYTKYYAKLVSPVDVNVLLHHLVGAPHEALGAGAVGPALGPLVELVQGFPRDMHVRTCDKTPTRTRRGHGRFEASSQQQNTRHWRSRSFRHKKNSQNEKKKNSRTHKLLSGERALVNEEREWDTFYIAPSYVCLRKGCLKPNTSLCRCWAGGLPMGIYVRAYSRELIGCGDDDNFSVRGSGRVDACREKNTPSPYIGYCIYT